MELKLLEQIEMIDQKIAELTAEKKALQRVIAKLHQQELIGRNITRKNSVGRIVIETQIVKSLREAGKPVSGADLFLKVGLLQADLKESTFRSYLHRMKEKEVIQSVKGMRGYWCLPQSGVFG